MENDVRSDYNSRITLSEALELILPPIKEWIKEVIRDEVLAALEEDRERKKPDKMYNRDEVCELLHISKPTLWKKTANGDIKATRIGRRVLYSEDEIQKYLEREKRS